MSRYHTTTIVRSIVIGLLAVITTVRVSAEEPTPSTRDRQDAFQARMQNVSLEGFFTVLTVDGQAPSLHAERYEIHSVRPTENRDQWLFEARIKYGEFDLTVPLPLPVEWAGATPVIVVDAVTIPGLGTFDARVMIDNDRYAGTWRHNEVSGHLFGRIRKMEASQESGPETVTDK